MMTKITSRECGSGITCHTILQSEETVREGKDF